MSLGKNEVPIIITIDMEWAPGYAVRWMVERLWENSVKATFFATDLAEIDYIRQFPELFELGIHPNFLPGSDHGETTEEVLEFCMKLVPEAVSMRTHCLVQSTPILRKALDLTPIENDCSLLLPFTPNVSGHKLYLGAARPLNRFPFVWEDDVTQMTPGVDWSLGCMPAQDKYLMVNFHPLTVYLNDARGESYRNLKKANPKIGNTPKEAADKLISSGPGPQKTFLEIIAAAKNNSAMVKELGGTL